MTGAAVHSASASSVSSLGNGRAPATTAATKKVTICHRTHSVTNPYVRITVAEDSIGTGNKHGGVKHNQWSKKLFTVIPDPNVFNSAITYTPAPEKMWGDIIPNKYVDGSTFSGPGAGTNYKGIGIDIYNGTGGKEGQCKVMNARDLYEVEKSNGTPTKDILDDLEESKESDEFKSALDACGGSFTNCTDPSKLGTMSITPETSTTVDPAATTVPTTTTVVSSGNGSLQVHTWIDANRNGKKASNEGNLEGQTVTIEGPNGETLTALTDASGIATFTNLVPGTWKVKSVLSKAGYSKVYDSDGSVNWATTLKVVAGKTAKASFAAAKGSAKVTLPTTGTDGISLQLLMAGLMVLAGFALTRIRRRAA